MRSVLLILTFMVFSSCVEKAAEYDMSSSGAVNSIKEINGEVYILNSTNSSILKLSGGQTDLFRDIEIEGRDFLLDFDIDRETVYYSNTYDEIFIAKGNLIEDTVKMISPDKIEVDGYRLFITTRKAEEGYFYLISADKITGDVFSRTALNDSPVTGGVFSTASITGSSKGLWLINTFKSRLELYGNELQLIEFFDLDRSYNYGNFRIGGDNARIICSKDGSIFISSVDLKSGDQRFSDRKCDSGTLDISVSAVTDNGIFIYDYLNGIIRIF